MPDLDVDGSVFSFPDGWEVSKYDEWAYFKNVLEKIVDPNGRGLHGCDIVALDGSRLWLIEAKDYAYREARVPQNLVAIVAEKVIDTLAGLHSGAKNEHDHQDFCHRAVHMSRLGVALRIDLPGAQPNANKMAKEAAIKAMADYQQEFRQVLKRVFNDGVYVVTGREDDAVVPWTVEWGEGARAAHMRTR